MVTRRDILKQAAGTVLAVSAAVVGGHQLLQQDAERRPPGSGPYPDLGTRLIRPPGAVAEAAFLAGCIRCYRCQDACSPGAIRFFTESAGELFHTPYIDPSVRACTLCMKCTKACPTGVLAPTEPEQRADVDMATVELREDLCLSYKAKRIRDEQAMLMDLGRAATAATAAYERRGPCGECYMVCPLRDRAISLEPGAFLAPIVHAEQCAGCGLCEEICRVMVRSDQPAIRVVSKRGYVS